MDILLNAKQAKKLDVYSIQTMGIPSLVLMERASLFVAEEIKRRFLANQSITVIAGVGNNGADGLAVARILLIQGWNVKLVIVGTLAKATEEFKTQYTILENMNTEFEIIDPSVVYGEEANVNSNIEIELPKSGDELVVDALFGIGLAREVQGIYRELICRINQSDAKVLSIDIPSGLNATTGEVMGISVKADYTVTFGKKKTGHFLCEGKEYCGELICGEIGYPEMAYQEVIPQNQRICFLETKDIEKIPDRQQTSNKGSYGAVGIVGGGALMSGAAILSSQAAYNCGAGLVRIYAGTENLDVIRSASVESVVQHFHEIYNTSWKEKKDVICIGPGLSVSEETLQILKYVLELKMKKVMDADALNLMAEHRELLNQLDERCILTPHVREMSRLTGLDVSDIRNHAVDVAKDFSKEYNCITVLKDAGTVIASADGRIRINTSGNSAMSKGGSGDVLAGIISGLLAQGMEPYEAATTGVYIHGLTGEKASAVLGEYSVNARNLVDYIYQVFAEYKR